MPGSFHPLLDPDLAQAVGELIAQWSDVQRGLTIMLLEFVIERPVKRNEDLSAIAPLIGMDARPLIGLLKTMAEIRLGARDGKKFTNILDKIDAIKSLRDACAHGIFEKQPKTEKWTVALIKATNSIKSSQWGVSQQSIHDQLSRLESQMRELVVILHAHGYAQIHAPSL